MTGVGIPAGRVETETGTRDGLGLQLIRGFSKQLRAELVVEQERGDAVYVDASAWGVGIRLRPGALPVDPAKGKSLEPREACDWRQIFRPSPTTGHARC